MRRFLIDNLKKLLDSNGLSIRRIDRSTAFADQSLLLASSGCINIIDGGAHIGSIARAYKAIFQESRIICVEPLEELALSLCNSLHSVEVVNCALGETNTEMPFNRSMFSAASSLLFPDIEMGPDSLTSHLKPKAVAPVSVRTLDSLCSELNIDHLHILKLDIQGAELLALKGAINLLSNKRISLIYCEVSFQPCYLDQPLFGDISTYLYEVGYSFHDLYNPEFCGITGRVRHGDFQGRCHSLAAIQAASIKGSPRIGSGSSGGLLIHTSSGWRQQRVDRLQRLG